MIYSTWLFQKKYFFPKFLGPIPRSQQFLALLTVKNEKKIFFAHILFILYLTPEKLLAIII